MNKINYFLEYFSAALIISYFFMKSIVLVLIGITISIYLMNHNSINRIIRSSKKIFDSIVDNKLNINDEIIKHDPNKTKLTKEDKSISLVEKIEELGYIPSTKKREDADAA